jgi:hypothetical protein
MKRVSMTSKGLEPVVCSECGLPWAGACVCLVIIILMCVEYVVVSASPVVTCVLPPISPPERHVKLLADAIA